MSRLPSLMNRERRKGGYVTVQYAMICARVRFCQWGRECRIRTHIVEEIDIRILEHVPIVRVRGAGEQCDQGLTGPTVRLRSSIVACSNESRSSAKLHILTISSNDVK